MIRKYLQNRFKKKETKKREENLRQINGWSVDLTT